MTDQSLRDAVIEHAQEYGVFLHPLSCAYNDDEQCDCVVADAALAGAAAALRHVASRYSQEAVSRKMAGGDGRVPNLVSLSLLTAADELEAKP